MAIAKICPTCHGCGRTSLNPYTCQPVPQPTYVSSGTTAQGWTKCATCGGVGVVSFIDKDRFVNGLSINEYLRDRLGDM
jgi:hypothetical protein